MHINAFKTKVRAFLYLAEKACMITPPAIQHGDTIGIVAPARSVTEEELQPFIKWAEKNGFRIKPGENIFGRLHQFAGSESRRLDDICRMMDDNEVKVILAARGGYGSARLLDEMDLMQFARNPKWIAGFSDITALMSAINRIAGVETLHALMPYTLYSHEAFDPESLDSLIRGLTAQKLTYKIGTNTLNVPGTAKGILTGGNLSVLYSLAGTPYEPDYEGKILFLEDVDEYLYHVDRMILNFELRGIFQRIAGLVIGDFSKMNDNSIPFGKNAFEIIAERAVKYNVPTMFGFPAGHENRNHTLIFGRETTLTIGEAYSELDFSG